MEPTQRQDGLRPSNGRFRALLRDLIKAWRKDLADHQPLQIPPLPGTSAEQIFHRLESGLRASARGTLITELRRLSGDGMPTDVRQRHLAGNLEPMVFEVQRHVALIADDYPVDRPTETNVRPAGPPIRPMALAPLGRSPRQDSIEYRVELTNEVRFSATRIADERTRASAGKRAAYGRTSKTMHETGALGELATLSRLEHIGIPSVLTAHAKGGVDITLGSGCQIEVKTFRSDQPILAVSQTLRNPADVIVFCKLYDDFVAVRGWVSIDDALSDLRLGVNRFGMLSFSCGAPLSNLNTLAEWQREPPHPYYRHNFEPEPQAEFECRICSYRSRLNDCAACLAASMGFDFPVRAVGRDFHRPSCIDTINTDSHQIETPVALEKYDPCRRCIRDDIVRMAEAIDRLLTV